jgi:hypothetical protein
MSNRANNQHAAIDRLTNFVRRAAAAVRIHWPLVVATVWLWSMNSGLAFAKKRAEVVEKPEKSYVLPYALVFLCIGLGVMFICRPSSRLDETLKAEDDEK